MDTTALFLRTKVQDRDKTIFRALNVHGPLSTPYLQAFVDDEHPSETGLKNRLTDLTTRGTRRLLKVGRPRQTQPYTYINSPEIDDYLLESKHATRRTISINDQNRHHEMLLSHITASIELGARQEGIDFVDEFQLLPQAPTQSREMPCEISHIVKLWDEKGLSSRPVQRSSSKALFPDAYFALRAQGREKVFFLEADCGTEQLSSGNLDHKSWVSTFLKYRKVIENGYYKKHFGLANDVGALVLIVTTSIQRMESMQRILRNLTDEKGAGYFLFKTWNDFYEDEKMKAAGYHFVPSEVNYDLALEPWYRTGKDEKTKLPYTPLHIC